MSPSRGEALARLNQSIGRLVKLQGLVERARLPLLSTLSRNLSDAMSSPLLTKTGAIPPHFGLRRHRGPKIEK